MWGVSAGVELCVLLHAATPAVAQNALLKEVGLLAKLTHPNLVRFCGVCVDPPMVIMQYHNGSLYKMLDGVRAPVLEGTTNKVCCTLALCGIILLISPGGLDLRKYIASP